MSFHVDMVTKRTYHGEESAKRLLLWLNQSKRRDKASHDRVSRLLLDLQAWERAYDEPGNWASTYSFLPPDEKPVQFDRRAEKQLREYLFSPQLRFTRAGWDLSWKLRHGKTSGFAMTQYLDGPGEPGQCRIPIKFGEPSAVMAIVRAAEQGFLDRIRGCRRCREWFYARFQHMVYCSENCQQMYVRSSSAWKKRKREKMRELRALHKRRLFK